MRGLLVITGVSLMASALIVLSMILTISVLYAAVSQKVIVITLVGGSAIAVIGIILVAVLAPDGGPTTVEDSIPPSRVQEQHYSWRMPPLGRLPPPQLTVPERLWLIVLRAYLVIAAGLVLVRIVVLAVRGG
jgi:hypothetical protein